MEFFLVGVKAGMFVRDAKALCPQLVILSYDFEAYEEVLWDWLNKSGNSSVMLSPVPL